MKQKPKCLNSKIIAQSKLFRIEARDLQFSNGEQRTYERLLARGDGAVLIVPMLDDNTVLLIREYAGGLDDYLLALPKGLIEKGEEPCYAANRELMEEVGYGAHHTEILKQISTNPGYTQATTTVILAKDLYKKRIPGDEPEEIEVVPWPLEQLNDLISREDFTEARSIAALYMVKEKLKGTST